MAQAAAAPGRASRRSAWRRSGRGAGRRTTAVAEQEIVSGIVSYIEANYRALPGRENRTLAGLSMGGGISINVGLKTAGRVRHRGAVQLGDVRRHRPGRRRGPGAGTGGGYPPFDIDAISPGFLKDAAATNKKLKLLYFSCGDDDPRMPFQKKVVEDFRAAKIALTFKNFPGAHEWRVWRNSLADLAVMLFM